jgi:colanic acid/amylovoran biosynthesis glycosyltransferase
MKPNVLIYRDRLLYPSETFIREQTESLERFTPYYLGARPIRGIETPGARTLFIGGSGAIGRMNEILFKGLHMAPFTFNRLSRIRPQLIHAHFGMDAVEAMPIARRLRVPLVVTFHGHDVNVNDAVTAMNRRGRRYLRHRHQLGKFSSLNIVVSRSAHRDLLARGFVNRDIFLHYIGVDVTKFSRNFAVARENIVLFVGRLVEMKGCEYAIRAMAALQQEIADTRLVIIGDGPLRPSLEMLARELNCRCEFLGVQSSEAVRGWMSRARVFCTPSVTATSGNVEAFGIVFIEAQAMELPVVSTTAGGIPEAVENGVTGLLAPEKDWRALAAHLHTMLTDFVLWEKFSLAGRQRVCREFNLQSQTRILEAKYQEVIEKWLATGVRPSLSTADEMIG